MLEDGELVELYVEDQDSQQTLGSIYRGRVVNVLPGMHAAFVDIGIEKNAFLYFGDINADKTLFQFGSSNSILEFDMKDSIREGKEITVQVVKEAMGTKGARVTTYATLPSRYLVLMPYVNHVGVSRRIESEEERQRLKLLAEQIKPKDMGVIVRTAAEGKQIEDIYPDIEFLCRLWNNIKDKESKGKAPKLIHRDESLIFRAVRDLFTGDVNMFIVNNREQYARVIELIELIAPSYKDRVFCSDLNGDVFSQYSIDSKIEKAIQKKVWLRNGGYLVIDDAEALTVIDVNTGKFVGKSNLEDTVLKTNLEAAEEIVRQVRLRDIGGIIIIDFIDMVRLEHREMVLNTLKQAFKKDRTKTHIMGFTGLGLVEMTRKKVRQRLASTLVKPCPYCSGTGMVYSEMAVMVRVEKELEKLFEREAAWGALVEVHPSVARLWMEENGKILDELETALNRRVLIKSNPDFHVEESNIKPIHSREEMMDTKKLIDNDEWIRI
jgi:ribonuclease G